MAGYVVRLGQPGPCCVQMRWLDIVGGAISGGVMCRPRAPIGPEVDLWEYTRGCVEGPYAVGLVLYIQCLFGPISAWFRPRHYPVGLNSVSENPVQRGHEGLCIESVHPRSAERLPHGLLRFHQMLLSGPTYGRHVIGPRGSRGPKENWGRFTRDCRAGPHILRPGVAGHSRAGPASEMGPGSTFLMGPTLGGPRLWLRGIIGPDKG